MACTFPKITGILLILSIISIASGQDIKQIVAKLFDECQKKTGAPNSDLELLKQHKAPATKEGICMYNCMYETHGVIKDGKFNKEALVAGLTPMVDESKIPNLVAMADKCEKGLSEISDKCEQSKVLAFCTAEEGEKFGFKYPTP